MTIFFYTCFLYYRYSILYYNLYERGGYDDGGKHGARVNCTHATDH